MKIPMAVVLIAAIALPGLAEGAKRALDGMTFSGDAGPKGKPAGGKDDLVFSGGRFRSKACDPWGFGDAPYTASARDGVVSFAAETNDGKGAKIAWKGTIRGAALEGAYVWTVPGKEPAEYWIKATLKK